MNGLGQLHIKGITVRLKFGLPAVRHIYERMDRMELIAGDQYTELGIAHILFAGYTNGCLLEDKAPVIPFEDFYNLVEEFSLEQSGKEQIIDAIRVFEESRYLKKAGEVNGEEKKSRLTGTKSKHSATKRG